MNWEAFQDELEKIAEPPPPKGVSVKEWDKILSKGPKSKAGSWTDIGPEPRYPRAYRPKFKRSSGDIDDIESGDPMRLMPRLRAIHKLGQVKEAFEIQDYELDRNSGKITSHYYGNRLGTMTMARARGLTPTPDISGLGYSAQRDVSGEELPSAKKLLLGKYQRQKERNKGLFGTPVLSKRKRKRYQHADSGIQALQKLGYRLQGHTDVRGLRVAIENRRGSVRKGKDGDGKEWRTKMKHPYGYFVGTKTKADDEPLDVYVGPGKDKLDHVFVVHQKEKETGKYDEDKVMAGFKTKREAKEAFLQHYDSPDFLGPISKVSLERLCKLVLSKKKLAKVTE